MEDHDTAETRGAPALDRQRVCILHGYDPSKAKMPKSVSIDDVAAARVDQDRVLAGLWARWAKEWHFANAYADGWPSCGSNARRYAEKPVETLDQMPTDQKVCFGCIQAATGHTPRIIRSRHGQGRYGLDYTCERCRFEAHTQGSETSDKGSLRIKHAQHVIRTFLLDGSDELDVRSLRAERVAKGQMTVERERFLNELTRGSAVALTLHEKDPRADEIVGRVSRVGYGDMPIEVTYESRQEHGNGAGTMVTHSRFFDVYGTQPTKRSSWHLIALTDLPASAAPAPAEFSFR